MQNKKDLTLIIIVGLILFLIIVAIVFIAFTAVSPVPEPEEELPSPTLAPTSSEDLRSKPPVIYDYKGQQELLERIEERQAISQSDDQAKTKMLSLLPAGAGSGTLYRTTTISIDYLKAPNIFQVEILTINITQAKQETVAWFVSQGFSQTAICNYPVQFYLNYAVAEQLRDKNITFSPLAPGCE